MSHSERLQLWQLEERQDFRVFGLENVQGVSWIVSFRLTADS